MWMMMIKRKWKSWASYLIAPLDANAQNSFFINETRVNSGILRSEKLEAKTFKKWVPSEVLHLCTF